MDPSSGAAPGLVAYYEEIANIKLLRDVRYSLSAVFFLLLYEWVANIGDEVKVVHLSRWSSVKVAYLLCRYYPLLYWPVVLWAYVKTHPPQLCKEILHIVHAFLAPCHFLGQAVMFMRAYAFSGRNRTVLMVLSMSYGFLIGSDIYLFFANIPIPDTSYFGILLPLDDYGCFPDYSTATMGMRLGIAMLAAIMLDFISLVVVIVYCVKRQTGQIPLAAYFLKQGLVAFASLGVTNAVAVIIYFESHSTFSDVGLPFILAASNIIACRLILSLRKRVIVTESQMSRDHSRLVQDAFANSMHVTDRDDWDIHEHAITTTSDPSEIQITLRTMHSAAA